MLITEHEDKATTKQLKPKPAVQIQKESATVNAQIIKPLKPVLFHHGLG